MDDADAIWNRACESVLEPPLGARSGDRALANMILVHGLTMNGGVLHAIEFLRSVGRWDALDGYRDFGFETVPEGFARFEEEANKCNGAGNGGTMGELEARSDDWYADLISDDAVLDGAFRARFLASPHEFLPPG